MPSSDRVIAPVAVRLSAIERQPGAYRAGSFGEQLRRRIGEHLFWRGALGWRVQGADIDLDLVGNSEGLAAGRDDGDAGAAAEDVIDEDGGGIHDVLAVVDQQQHAAPGQERDEPVAEVSGRDGTIHRHAKGVGDRDRHLIGGVHRRQTHAEGTVRIVRGRADDGGQGQGGLPGASGTNEGEQSCAAEELGDGVQLVVAADQRADHVGQVRRRRAVLVGAGLVSRHREVNGRGPCRRRIGCRRCRRSCWAGGHVPRGAEGGVLAQHPLVQRPQGHRRFKAEGLGEDLPGAGVHVEGVGLPAAAVQRQHQQPGERLRRRILGDDGFEVGDDFPVPAQRQRHLRAFGHGRHPELGQAGGFGHGPLFDCEVAERVTAPQREGVVVGLHVGRVHTAVVGCVRGGRARVADAIGEVERVHSRGVDGGAVPGRLAGDDVADPHGLEGAPQLGHANLQRVHRVDRQRRFRPQPVDEHGGRDGAAGVEEELGEQRAFGGAGKLHGCAVDTDLHRPEQPVSHVVQCRSPSARRPSSSAGADA